MAYQLLLRNPGISPFCANSRTQIRHMLKKRKYPRLRPQRQHRRTSRVENFGVFSDRAITDFFAILYKINIYKM